MGNWKGMQIYSIYSGLINNQTRKKLTNIISLFVMLDSYILYGVYRVFEMAELCRF
jgi:hypothetical protein